MPGPEMGPRVLSIRSADLKALSDHPRIWVTNGDVAERASLGGRPAASSQARLRLPEESNNPDDKCRQPDAEVEDEPDHSGLITYDYDNF